MTDQQRRTLLLAGVVAAVGAIAAIVIFLWGGDGEAVDGRLSFEVTRVDCGLREVGDEFLSAFAEKGRFCLIDLTVRNTGSGPAVYSYEHQRLLVDDRLYRPFLQAIDALRGAGTPVELDPGDQIEAIVAFDVRPGGPPQWIEVHESGRSEGVRIDL